jgi:hypothetical protein
MIYEEDHYMKYFPHHEVVAKFLKGASRPVQQKKIVAKTPAPLQGGNICHYHHEDASSSSYKVNMFKAVNTMINKIL